MCKCHTKKREEATAAANQSSQSAQANTSTSTKPKNKPVGSTNITFKDDLDNGGFWAATTENIAPAYPYCAELDPLIGELEDDNDNEWEAFRTETWGKEDEGEPDWAGFGIQLVKEGEECDAEEEARAAALPEKEDTPCSESRPTPHNVLHVLASNNLVPCQALDEGGHTPQIGDGHPQTTSLYGEQVTDTMHHAHRLHDTVRPLESAHLNDPKPAICVRKGQSPGFDANVQAYQAPWPRPGTMTKEQGVHWVPAALLEGEEKRMPAMSSEQAAALGTRSTSNALTSPTLSSEATPSSPEPAPELDISPSPAESAKNPQQELAFTLSHIDTATVEIWFDPDPQPGDGVAHSGTNALHLARILQRPGAFMEDPEESGGVLMEENGVPPLHTDPDGTVSTFMAETTGAGAPDHCIPVEAKHSHGQPPWDKPTEKPTDNPATCKACTVMQGPHQTSSINTNDPDQSDHGGHTVHPLQPAHTNATFPHYQLAIFKPFPISVDHQVPSHTDPAPATTAECTTTCDMPHRKAIKTSNWAVLVTCPATTFADTNGTITVYWHATSGHTFPIDGGTMPLFSR